MIIDDYIRYIGAARRYSPRTLAVYRDSLTRFSAFAGEGSPASDDQSSANRNAFIASPFAA